MGIVYSPSLKSMTEPTQLPQATDPNFGFNSYAERLNGRAAMIGFLTVLVIEFSTGKGVLTWLGLISG
jgi:hypothetical protein